ncbi:MAG: hypothetical protein V3V96_15585 [Acidiferrobacterales bacterium]
MGKKSRDKGKHGEREVVQLLRAHGIKARRGQQFAGGGDSPDIVHNIPDVHIEVKRRETFNLYESLDQAMKDAGLFDTSVVFYRKNNRPWVVVLDAEDFLNIMAERQCDD